MKSEMGNKLGALVAAGAMMVIVSSARADLTPVFAPASGELSHVDILNHVYGAGFAGPLGAASYTNGLVTATRIDDVLAGGGLGSNLNMVSGAPGLPNTDQFWVDGIASATAEAKFAAFSQEFGYDLGSGYTNLFDVTVAGPSGFDVSGSGVVHFPHNNPWQWVRSGAQGQTYYSGNANNSDLLDHMVTYQITGASSAANETVWLLLWEDLNGPLNGAGHSDRDFNDLAVEIRATVVPIPGALVMAGLGVGIVGLIRRRMA